ncbi:ribonuclease E inhibitor RraB [Mucilaginibacter sp. RCC_168]|uniref:ribonuclease E inhibitor RraB n=1 Tax=Mucilaginibacter sp. RCC_168 TaxID=3239221 RepID=UPI00352599D4
MENTYFDQESYENDIELEVNEDVLDRIYRDGVTPIDKLPIEFYFLTDTEVKAIHFKKHLQDQFPDYNEIVIRDYNGDFEISGFTDPKEMKLNNINNWNKVMWDLGYKYDCKLDGWQVGT